MAITTKRYAMSINMLALARKVKEEKKQKALEAESVRSNTEASTDYGDDKSTCSSARFSVYSGYGDRFMSPESIVDKKPHYAADVRLAVPPLTSATAHKVGSIDTVFYFNSALSAEESTSLLRILDDPDLPSISSRWVQLKARRLQKWGGDVLSDGLHNVTALPPFLENLCTQLVVCGVFPAEYKPNHVLINEYLGGQGIMPHTDGPAYYPQVATISIGCDALMHFTTRKTDESGKFKPQQLVLRANSLVVFREDAYTSVLHSIDGVFEEEVGKSSECVNFIAANSHSGEILERTRRVSLTIRHVPIATPS